MSIKNIVSTKQKESCQKYRILSQDYLFYNVSFPSDIEIMKINVRKKNKETDISKSCFISKSISISVAPIKKSQFRNVEFYVKIIFPRTLLSSLILR